MFSPKSKGTKIKPSRKKKNKKEGRKENVKCWGLHLQFWIYTTWTYNNFLPCGKATNSSDWHTGGCVHAYHLQFGFSLPDPEHPQGVSALTFFPLFYHLEKLSPRQGSDPFNSFKAESDARCSTHISTKKGSRGFSRCPFSSHGMDSVGIWQINAVKLALASVGLHQLLRNFMKAAYYKSMAVIKSK